MDKARREAGRSLSDESEAMAVWWLKISRLYFFQQNYRDETEIEIRVAS